MRKKKWKVITAVLAAALVVNLALLIWLAFFVGQPAVTDSKDTSKTTSNAADSSSQQEGDNSFRFTGVGDNLVHGAIYSYPDHSSGYDFSWIYEPVKSYIQAADLAYINAETLTIAEYDEELSSYPTFNGPIEFIGNIADAGFDWISLSSNHSMDLGTGGLIFEKNYIEENYPDLTATGSAASEQEANTPVVLDINGIKVGLTGYTYGTNGIPIDAEYSWVLNVYHNDDGSIDYDTIAADLEALSAASDVQIVTMHWGEEYNTSATEEQQALAQFLHEHGVEVIIGTHPHVIGPVEIITDDDQQTLVYYSLGNFVSAQDERERMVGGMADFVLHYDPQTRITTFSDVKFIPTITWYPSNYSLFQTYTITDYTDELAYSHGLYTDAGQDLSKAWVQEYVGEVVGQPSGIEVVLE